MISSTLAPVSMTHVQCVKTVLLTTLEENTLYLA